MNHHRYLGVPEQTFWADGFWVQLPTRVYKATNHRSYIEGSEHFLLLSFSISEAACMLLYTFFFMNDVSFDSSLQKDFPVGRLDELSDCLRMSVPDNRPPNLRTWEAFVWRFHTLLRCRRFHEQFQSIAFEAWRNKVLLSKLWKLSESLHSSHSTARDTVETVGSWKCARWCLSYNLLLFQAVCFVHWSQKTEALTERAWAATALRIKGSAGWQWWWCTP